MRKIRTTGIYAITHGASRRVYVGSAVNIESRWDYHRERLTKRTHGNSYLTRAWHKYGADAFTFSVLEALSDPALLIAREQFWIDSLRAAERRYGFNLSPTAGNNLGVKHSAKIRAAVRRRLLGRKHTPQTIEKMRIAAMGNRRGVANLAAGQVRAVPDEQARLIKQRLADGLSARAVSRETGVPDHTVRRLWKGISYANIAPELNERIDANRPEWRRGGTNPNARLTEDDVRIIRQRLVAGDSVRTIATDFAIGQGTIRAIRQRRIWRELQ